MENLEREFGWEDEITKEGDEFILLPEGEYDFTVLSMTRGRFNGSAKLPACNQAILKIEVTDGSNKVVINHSLFLHSKCEGLLSAFFIAIGQKKHGEPLRMNWTSVPGSKGRCKVIIDKWNYEGRELSSNKIKSFIDPTKNKPAEAPQQKAFTPGAF